jgi:hypothetical protein
VWKKVALVKFELFSSGMLRKTPVRKARLAAKYETRANNSAVKFGKM